METTVPQPTPEAPRMTPEQAESYGIVLKHIEPFFDKHHAHVERVNDQAQRAARPVFYIVGGVAAAVGAAALWAMFVNEGQLSRELLLPLLAFAGGLAAGKAANTARD